MSTLSLDLRGVEASHALPRQAKAKGASVSLLLHTVGISTLALIPLLEATNPPEVAHAMSTPLVRPIVVTLPPAPLRVAAARPGSRSVRPPSQAVAPLTPTDTPTTFNLAHDLDVTADPIGDIPTAPGGDPDGAIGGTCPLGSLCGAAAIPIEGPPPSLVRIGGAIREPRLKESRAPIYPPIAQAAGAAGTVVLEARVGQDGRVREVRITESRPLFDAAALASVRSRVYEPLLLNGVPTEFLVTIKVTFSVRR